MEVQCRFDFDERIRIVSLDGRTWPVGTPLLFTADGLIDGWRLLETLRPDVIIGAPQVVRPERPDFITQCFARPVGTEVWPQPGLRILRTSYGLQVLFPETGKPLVPSPH